MEILPTLKWLVDVVGALNTVLVCFCVWMGYQLLEEQKESKETRKEMAEALNRSTEIQLSFLKSLQEAKDSIKEILYRKP